MWEVDLIHDISWRTRNIPGIERRRPKTWAAPSWSWASIKSEVTYEEFNPKIRETHSRVLSVQSKPQSVENSYGPVRSGTLELEGPCLEFAATKDFLTRPFEPMHMLDDNYELHWDVSPESEADLENAGHVRLLLLCSTWPEQALSLHLVFIILGTLRTNVDTWERLGLASVQPKSGHSLEREKLRQWIGTLPMVTVSVM
jgi:hypothetical protein